MSSVIITLDGTSASGKGTIATLIANTLKYSCLNTGLLFRKLAYYIFINNINFYNDKELSYFIQTIDFSAKLSLSSIYSTRISDLASKISTLKIVRTKLLEIQRNFPNNKKGVVIEGRDIGTVVFPNANFKFFLDADIKERAMRRYKQLQTIEKNITVSSVLKSIKIRDKRDKSRQYSPLLKAKDSIFIDTSGLNTSDILEKILKKIKNT